MAFVKAVKHESKDSELLRFWNTFVANISESGECWLWLGGKTAAGYGVMPRPVYGHRISAHRYSYALFNNSGFPEVVRHKCDNPACVNPEHLEGGTHADNVRDRIKRGRPQGKQSKPQNYPSGEAMSNARLTAEQVRIIRDLYKPQTASVYTLAAEYGVSASSIKRVLNGQNTGTTLSQSQKQEIQYKYSSGQGYSTSRIAGEFGVSCTVIKRIISGKAWKGIK